MFLNRSPVTIAVHCAAMIQNYEQMQLLKKQVLVIDDNNSIRHLLGSILSKDYDVVTLNDGMEAMAWLMQGNLPHAILLDINMPRLDGIGFLQNIRNSGFFRELPVIVITASDDDDMVTRCKFLGVKNFLTKPFNPLKLREQLKEIFEIPEVFSSN